MKNFMKLLQAKNISALILLMCSVIFGQNSYGQINQSFTASPPDLFCVRNDSVNRIELKWNLPSNAGTCFKQWGIYYSQGSSAGPYIKIDSVSNIAATSHKINIPNSRILYFIVVNEQNCLNPNPPAQYISDTLDNIVPKPVVNITAVTVENDKAVVRWQAAPSKEVEAYVIYSSEDNFSSAIDTVFGRTNTSFTDNNSAPSSKIYAYKIRALEFCESPQGLLGNISEAYNTLLLKQIADDPCLRSVTVSWSRYYNAQVNGFSVQIKKPTDPDFVQIAKVIANDTAYQIQDLTPGENIEIRIVGALLNDSTVSNIITTAARGILPVETHYISTINVLNDNIELEYVPDPNTTFVLIAGERSRDGINYGELTSGASITGPPPGTTYSLNDFGVNFNRFDYWYRIRVTDSCGFDYYTLPAKSILIKGENNGTSNEIDFSNLFIDSANVLQYNIYRIEGTDTIFVNSQSNAGSYVDLNVFSNEKFDPVCYFIKADYSFTQPGRPAGTFSSVSNQVCLQPRPKAAMPTGFVPEGYNKIYRPILLFAKTENYLFEVYNRWGQKMFSSNIPGIGWDGTYNGTLQPADSYLYFVTFTGTDNNTYERRGSFTLVR